MEFIRKYGLIVSVALLIFSLLFPGTVVGLAVTLLIVGMLVLNPKQGILFLIVYFPVRPFLIEVNDSIKFVGDLLIILLFIKCLPYYFKNKGEWKQGIVFIAGFLAFCAIGAASALLTGVSIGAIVFQLRAFLITFLLIFVVRSLDITKKDVISFLWVTILMAVLLSVHGIIEKVSLRTMFLPKSWENMHLAETNRMRIYGLIGNPNVLATYLSIAFIFTLYLKRIVQNKQVLITAFSVLIFGAFILTYSRGTIIALGVGLVVYLFLSRDWKIFKPLLLSLVLSLPLVYYPVVQLTTYMENHSEKHQSDKELREKNGDFSQRMNEAFNKDTIKKSTAWGRLYVVNRGFEIFKEHPVIGTGFGTYGDSASLAYSSPIYERYKIPENLYSDNQFIQVIVQTGAMGVVTFAVFILGMVGSLWKRRKENAAAIALIAILAGGFAAGMFYNIFEDKTFTLYYYILIGFVLNSMVARNGTMKR
ncbi:O-antigen ligase family protein [Mesobacillus zeae]|uniref:O-antigen ligase family protein n=1 Tax=Mesobacillus zeae TaxID=1917180 RepID=A0A398AWU9_9BACI|nr:O-antigen ligase family protein [Mesobacillus zeae]RID82139.1 O-antigen ligase family protein [Mesobacillus zeae]